MSEKTNEDHLQRVRSIGPSHLIIDGSLLVARMAYATELSPVFLHGDETDMNGVSGFLEEIQTVRGIFPSIREVHVVWEGGGRAMRRAIFPAYKAQRDKPSKGSDYMRARVFPAKKLLRERILPRTPFHQVEPRCWEGDDGMGDSLEGPRGPRGPEHHPLERSRPPPAPRRRPRLGPPVEEEQLDRVHGGATP